MTKIKTIFVFLFITLFNLTLSEQIIFRTTISPGRVFIDSKGGNSSITVSNTSQENLEILVGTENDQEENIKFFPKKFILSPNSSQIVRLQVKKDFFQLREEEKILYVTEHSPLVVVNNKKFRPRHGITVKPLGEK